MGFTYTPNMPVATNFPSNDQPLMNQNSQYLNAFGNKDHNLSQNSANVNDGYHKQVTFNTNHATTGFASGVSVLYANTANGQSQMFYNNASGNIQMTVVKASVPTVSGNGCSFLPGGILIQWGLGTNGATFPVAFTTLYSVTATPTGFLSSNPAVTAVSTTAFTFANAGGQAFNNYWMAIGLA